MSQVSPLLAANLHRLACPVCYSALALTEITVDCTGCHRRYPIVDGLAVLIASRAILPDAADSLQTSPDPLSAPEGEVQT